MTESIAKIGLQGMQRGLSGAAEAAERISRAFSPESTEEPTDAIVDMKVNIHQAEVSAKLIKADEELSGSILDILA